MKKIFFLISMVFWWNFYCNSMGQYYKSSAYRAQLFNIAAYGNPDQMKQFESEYRLKKIYSTILSNRHKSVLHHASRKGNMPMVKHILGQISDDEDVINGFDDAHKTPLYDALVHGNNEVAEELLAHGAKLRLGRQRSFSILTAARISKSKRQKQAIKHYLITKNEDQECDICLEEFKESCAKVISDDICLRVLCKNCKALYDKCPFCRAPYKKKAAT